MLAINLLREIGTLAGYTVDGSSGSDPSNKARALRRVNSVKADIISRYGGKWDSNYREGWLPLLPLYVTGTADFTLNSRTVTGHSTVWDATMNGAKIMGSDGAYYKIASIISATSLVLTQPFQGPSTTLHTYQIWQDEYVLYSEVLTIGGFLDYQFQGTMIESWPRNMKDSYPVPVNSELPTIYTVIGRQNTSPAYSIGTISGSVNDNYLTGLGTSWLSNIQPGYEILVGTIAYHVRRVLSDTSIELYQRLSSALTGSAYTAKGKNSIIVRFREPTSQRIVHYWYWAKDYPFVNDNDEDWVAETYSEVILNGAVRKDYLDKNDVARASLSKQEYEDSIKNMKVACDGAMSGPRTLGYNIPPEARD